MKNPIVSLAINQELSPELEEKILERADRELQRIADASGQQIRLLNITATRRTLNGARSHMLYQHHEVKVRVPMLQMPWHAKSLDGRSVLPIVPGADVVVREPRFKLINFDDIEVSTEACYLAKGLIPRGGLTVVWGPPKCGKTFFVSDLALHIALGWDYRGRRVKQGSVVYLVLEGSRGFKARIAAFKLKHMETYAGPPVPFHIIDVAVKLAADHVHLIEAIKLQLAENPALVVVDTLNRSLSGSESSDADMAAFIQAADAIRFELNCAAIVVHHSGWDTSRMRGHTSLPGALDAEIGVTRNEAKEIMAEILRMKDGEEGDVLASKLEKVDLGDDEDGDPISACVIVPIEGSGTTGPRPKKLAADAAKALAALDEVLDDQGTISPTDPYIPANTKVVTKDQWKAHALKRGFGAAREYEAIRKAFNRAFDSLQKLNRIGVSDPFVWPI
jgi:hypothetical protein